MRFFQAFEKFLEIVEATLTTSVIVAPTPTATIEPRTGRVHHAMEDNMITMLVDEPATFSVEGRQRLNALRGNECGNAEHEDGAEHSLK